MVVNNPYAKKKQQGSSSKVPKATKPPINNITNHSYVGVDNDTKAPPGGSKATDVSLRVQRDTPTSHRQGRPSKLRVATSRTKKSFKSQLKQEIKQIKRAKELEKQRKIQAEMQRKRALEREQREKEKQALLQQRQEERMRKQRHELEMACQKTLQQEEKQRQQQEVAKRLMRDLERTRIQNQPLLQGLYQSVPGYYYPSLQPVGKPFHPNNVPWPYPTVTASTPGPIQPNVVSSVPPSAVSQESHHQKDDENGLAMTKDGESSSPSRTPTITASVTPCAITQKQPTPSNATATPAMSTSPAGVTASSSKAAETKENTAKSESSPPVNPIITSTNVEVNKEGKPLVEQTVASSTMATAPSLTIEQSSPSFTASSTTLPTPATADSKATTECVPADDVVTPTIVPQGAKTTTGAVVATPLATRVTGTPWSPIKTEKHASSLCSTKQPRTEPAKTLQFPSPLSSLNPDSHSRQRALGSNEVAPQPSQHTNDIGMIEMAKKPNIDNESAAASETISHTAVPPMAFAMNKCTMSRPPKTPDDMLKTQQGEQPPHAVVQQNVAHAVPCTASVSVANTTLGPGLSMGQLMSPPCFGHSVPLKHPGPYASSSEPFLCHNRGQTLPFPSQQQFHSHWRSRGYHLPFPYDRPSYSFPQVMGGLVTGLSSGNTPITYNSSSTAPLVAAQNKKTKPSKPMILHEKPMTLPSPYAETHELLCEEIIIAKSVGGSFGVIVKHETRSTLVDPPPVASSGANSCKVPTPAAAPANTTAQEITKTCKVSSEDTCVPSVQVKTTPPEASKTDGDGNVAIPIHQSVQALSTNVSSGIIVNAAAVQSKSNDSLTGILQQQQPKKQRRRRRRRVFFGVMAVVDVTKQYACNDGTDSKARLLPGDIILKINGHNTGGLPFSKACALLSHSDMPPKTIPHSAHCDYDNKSADDKSEKRIICSLVVARPKQKQLTDQVDAKATVKHEMTTNLESLSQQKNLPAVAPPLTMIPLVIDNRRNQVLAGEFSNTEMMALAKAMISCLGNPERVLGYSATPEDLAIQCKHDSLLARRDVGTMMKRLFHASVTWNTRMAVLARKHWREQWELESSKYGSPVDGATGFLSDAQRSALRALPRPVQGCKCGSPHHQHVHDPKCTLYRNVRHLRKSDSAEEPSVSALKGSLPKNLNAMETAYKDRFLKLRTEKELDREEARFVQEMEELQVKELKTAVFSPSLTAMVLSAVFEISANGPQDIKAGQMERAALPAGITNVPSSDLKDDETASSDDDDDDDLPLVALGKRSSVQSSLSVSKKPKTDPAGQSESQGTKKLTDLGFNLNFLARLLKHISCTWGHVSTEPSDIDYAWRWEVYRGQTGCHGGYGGITKTASKNPRLPGSLSFENIRFALEGRDFSETLRLGNDRFVGSTTNPESNQKLISSETENMVLLTYLLSPSGTGLYDELAALVRSGVLEVTPQGTAAMTQDWYTRVDVLLLNDMHEKWSKSSHVNHEGFCVSEDMRTTLERYWTRVSGGWAFADDVEDVIYEDAEYDEWRRSFRDDHQAQADDDEGIGKFGF